MEKKYPLKFYCDLQKWYFLNRGWLLFLAFSLILLGFPFLIKFITSWLNGSRMEFTVWDWSNLICLISGVAILVISILLLEKEPHLFDHWEMNPYHCVESRTCKRCGCVEEVPERHTFRPAGDARRVCQKCGVVEVLEQEYAPCSECHGRGTITHSDAEGMYQYVGDASDMGGTCSVCEGTGQRSYKAWVRSPQVEKTAQ